MKPQPKIPQRLLWEYDFSSFDFDKSYKIVIERILERGTIPEWKEMVNYYSREQILETIEWSSKLQEREKKFARFFITSDLLYAA